MQLHVQHAMQRGAVSDQLRLPTGITLQSGEFTRKVRTQYYAFYAQEQWTKDRLTLQGALRFDHAWSSFPEQQIGPSVTIPTANRPARADKASRATTISARESAWPTTCSATARRRSKANVGRYLHPASNQGRYINANPSELVSTITDSPVDGQQRQLSGLTVMC